jgi:hypothetical protein
MKKKPIIQVSRTCSDEDLQKEVLFFAFSERRWAAHLVAGLGEIEDRRLYLSDGFASLLDYCTQGLHLSAEEAHSLIDVARAARRSPLILEMLARGDLDLSIVELLVPHLTPENHRQLLQAARDRSQFEIEEQIASPTAASAPMIRSLPAATRPGRSLPLDPADDGGANVFASSSFGPPEADPTSIHEKTSAVTSRPTRPQLAVITPLEGDRCRIQFTAGAETHAKFRRAQDLLRHEFPDADGNAVLERALSLLVGRLEGTEGEVLAAPTARASTDRRASSPPS